MVGSCGMGVNTGGALNLNKMDETYSKGTLTRESLESWMKDIFANNRGASPRQFWIGVGYANGLSDEDLMSLVNNPNVQLMCGGDAYDIVERRIKEIESKPK